MTPRLMRTSRGRGDGLDADRGILDHLVVPAPAPPPAAPRLWGRALCGMEVVGRHTWGPSPPGAVVTCPVCKAKTG